MPIFSQHDLPEVFGSGEFNKDKIYYLQRAGTVKRIASSLYTSCIGEDLNKIVARNLWRIVAILYPKAIVSERSAIEMKPSKDGSIFIISDKKRYTSVGNIVIRPKKGARRRPEDAPFMENLFMASPARIILENAMPSRSGKHSVRRGLSQTELEEYLDRFIGDKGEAAVNKLRDQMKKIAPKLKLESEFKRVNKIISALLQTHGGNLKSKSAIARSAGFPFDGRRIEIFKLLYSELKKIAPVIRAGKFNKNLVFFESYFSNFIEGTEFAIDEARDIIFRNVVPSNRPDDAHDIQGTFKIAADNAQMKKIPATFDDFMDLLKTRHKTLMSYRSDKNPGILKERSNQAGTTLFVAPQLAIGTLKQGFEIYKKLDEAFSRAVFMMFLVSEVHPFNDGNGRIGRIMMNAELANADEQRIIIPTIYRTNYISALKALSHSKHPMPLIRTLNFAQKYTGAIGWNNFKTALDTLTKTNAFMDPYEADENGIRLTLPSRIIG